MTDNYAESAVAFPLFVAPSIIAPLTEIPTPVAASVTVNENGFCSFEVSIEFDILTCGIFYQQFPKPVELTAIGLGQIPYSEQAMNFF